MPPYKQLEKEYAQFVGTRHAVACNSGTSALHLALLSVGVGPGDEVIVPDFTMAACGFAVSYTGAKVVTVDCGEDLNIDVSKIEEKITERTKAIMAVHIYGRLCDMQAVREIADRRGLKVVEDACEAQGAADGKYSDCVVFSFYRNKIICAEEGGILCTDDPEIARRADFLKNMAFGDRHDYFHTEIGFNYRMPDFQALMAIRSLHDFTDNSIKRRSFETRQMLMLSDKRKRRDAVWVFDMPLCESEAQRDAGIEFYRSKGIQARHFFKPLSTMPMWEQSVGQNALRYSQLGFYIPVDLT